MTATRSDDFEARLSNVLRRTSALHPDDQAERVIDFLMDFGVVHDLTEGTTGRRLVSLVFSLPDDLLPRAARDHGGSWRLDGGPNDDGMGIER